MKATKLLTWPDPSISVAHEYLICVYIIITRKRMHSIFGERERPNMEEARLASSLRGGHASSIA